jgi:hypothetical protein
MLIIGLIAAVCFYVLLYWIYVAIETQLGDAYTTLQIINQAIMAPQSDIFMLLRGLIIVTFFYVLADMLLSPARRGMRKREWNRREANRKVFTGAPVPKAPAEEDDDSLDTPTFAPPRFSA